MSKKEYMSNLEDLENQANQSKLEYDKWFEKEKESKNKLMVLLKKFGDKEYPSEPCKVNEDKQTFGEKYNNLLLVTYKNEEKGLSIIITAKYVSSKREVKYDRSFKYDKNKEPESLKEKIEIEKEENEKILKFLEIKEIEETLKELFESNKNQNEESEKVIDIYHKIKFLKSEYAIDLILSYFDEKQPRNIESKDYEKEFDVDFHDDTFVSLSCNADEVVFEEVVVKKDYSRGYYIDNRKRTLGDIKRKFKNALIFKGEICRDLRSTLEIIGYKTKNRFSDHFRIDTKDVFEMLKEKTEKRKSIINF